MDLTVIVLLLAGLALLIVGAEILIRGATRLALSFGITPLVVGLTVVAYGTSAPEAAVNIQAVSEGSSSIAVGNVVGSNIINILCVMGVSSLLAPNGVEVAGGALSFDIPVMCAAALACLPIFFTGHRISRWEGGLFLLYYITYTVYLVLDATQHDALHPFRTALVYFALPLTVVTVGIFTARALRSRGGTLPKEGT